MKKKRWTAKEIRALRTALDLTQAAFGEKLGVTGNYVWILENEQKAPSLTLQRLLDCIDRDAKGGKT